MAEEIGGGYAPSSLKEVVKFGLGAMAFNFALKTFAPGLALKAKVTDGVWVKTTAADGSPAMQWQPAMPTAAK